MEKNRTEYKKQYQQDHYRAYTVRFNLVAEADYIEMIDNSSSVKGLIIEALKALKREQSRKEYLKNRRQRLKNEKESM
ncbi:MAG: hypothetical protein IKE77_00590 [Erysipelotrichaceae bacterium]|nr:hypothetical protein [Erysipelotrichaceae bacterium]